MNALLRFTLAFAAGILLASQTKAAIQPWQLSAGATVAILLVFLQNRLKTSRYTLGILLICMAVILGYVVTPRPVVSAVVTQATAYEAFVVAPAESRRNSNKVEVEVRKARVDGKWIPLKAKVLLYLNKAATAPRYGDVLVIWGAPQPTEPPQNPNQFDYRRFLALRQIYHTHYLRVMDFAPTGRNEAVWYKLWAYNLSAWSDRALKRLIPWEREYAVTKAMVLGIRDEMDPELTAAYSAAGAVHVLSVSGFHIAIFVWILSKLFFLLKEKGRRRHWAYVAITLIIMWFYAVLTGLSAPVIRSALMFTVFLLAKPFKRKENAVNALFASALILLVLDPLLLFSVSFQLSYAALGGILFWQPLLKQSLLFENVWANRLWEITAAALTAQLATFPLGAYYFHQFPNYFLLANPAVMGLGMVQLPAALVTIVLSFIPYVGETAGWITTLITWLLNQSVIWTDALPFSKLTGLSLDFVELMAVYLIISFLVALLLYQEKKWVWAALTVSTLLAGYQFVETKQQQRQRLLVIHAVSRHTAISLIDGQRTALIADTMFLDDKRSFNFTLDNFYVRRGIRNGTLVSLENPVDGAGFVRVLPYGKLITWRGKKILVVEQRLEQPVPPVADYILIKENAFRKIEDVHRVFGTQRVVFDNTTKFYLVESLQQAASANHLPYHFTTEQGAVVLEW